MGAFVVVVTDVSVCVVVFVVVGLGVLGNLVVVVGLGLIVVVGVSKSKFFLITNRFRKRRREIDLKKKYCIIYFKGLNTIIVVQKSEAHPIVILKLVVNG